MQDAALGPASVLEGHEDGHDDRGTAHEDARDSGFRRPFGGDHREVEADHADGREQCETAPPTRVEGAQTCHGAPADQG